MPEVKVGLEIEVPTAAAVPAGGGRMKKVTLTTAALALLAPACAMALPPPNKPAPVPGPGQPSGRQPVEINQPTFHLANCAIARNSGDARWLGLVVNKRANLAPEKEKGAQLAAMQATFYGCPVEGADFANAFRLAGAMLRYHPDAVNLPRRTDALADCIARSAPRDALAFVEGVDAKLAAQDPAPAKDYPALLAKVSKTCAAELPKGGDKVQENELYSRLNWDLRAAPALSQSPATKAAGR